MWGRQLASVLYWARKQAGIHGSTGNSFPSDPLQLVQQEARRQKCQCKVCSKRECSGVLVDVSIGRPRAGTAEMSARASCSIIRPRR